LVDLGFENLKHMRKPVLVECVSTCFSFKAPIFVRWSEKERIAKQVLENICTFVDLFCLLVVLVVDVRGNLGITIDDDDFGHMVQHDERSFLAAVASF